ncbi:MAG: hypothetical protein ACLFPJ_02100 [Candidatus Woesearchaeota archaeon]
MATPTMNIELLQHFSPVFVFLFVFAMFFAFLQWSKLFGDVKSLHAMMALVIAFMATVFSTTVREIIIYIIPWFVFLMIFAVFIIMVIKMFGVTDSNLHTIIKEPGVYWSILIVCLVILLGGLSHVFGQESLEKYSGVEQNETSTYVKPGDSGSTDSGTTDFSTNVGATFYNPQVLGMLFLLLIAAIGTKMLSSPPLK